MTVFDKLGLFNLQDTTRLASSTRYFGTSGATEGRTALLLTWHRSAPCRLLPVAVRGPMRTSLLSPRVAPLSPRCGHMVRGVLVGVMLRAAVLFLPVLPVAVLMMVLRALWVALPMADVPRLLVLRVAVSVRILLRVALLFPLLVFWMALLVDLRHTRVRDLCPAALT